MSSSKTEVLRRTVLANILSTVIASAVMVVVISQVIRGLRYATSVWSTLQRSAISPIDASSQHENVDDADKSTIHMQMHDRSLDWRSAHYVASVLHRFMTMTCTKNTVKSSDYQDMGLDIVSTIGMSPVLGIAGIHGDTLWIAMRGAQTIEELKTMSVCSQQRVLVSTGFCDRSNIHTLYHRGLLSTYGRIASDIDRLIRSDEMKMCKSVVIGGFSMGAGLAPLIALHIENRIPDKTRVFLMGSPRSANHATARQIQMIMKDRIVRVVNEDDMICSVPLVNWPDSSTRCGHCEYAHIGKVGMLFNVYKGNFAKTHSISNYLEAIDLTLRGPSVLSSKLEAESPTSSSE